MIYLFEKLLKSNSNLIKIFTPFLLAQNLLAKGYKNISLWILIQNICFFLTENSRHTDNSYLHWKYQNNSNQVHMDINLLIHIFIKVSTVHQSSTKQKCVCVCVYRVMGNARQVDCSEAIHSYGKRLPISLENQHFKSWLRTATNYFYQWRIYNYINQCIS